MSNDLSENIGRLVFLGVGQAALAVAALAEKCVLLGTTRDASKIPVLQLANISPFLIQGDSVQWQAELEKHLYGANILVSFPPNGQSDAIFSSLCSKSNAIVYLSSTSVYGSYSGDVDESTPVDWHSERSRLRLEAEQFWLNRGAIVLRAPGLYGPQSGLHRRLSNGSYRLPQKNDNYLSRIHLKDLARIILSAFAKPLPPGSIYLVGDLEPATQIEVVRWLCRMMNLSAPQLAAPDAMPETLMANRRVNPKRILHELNLDLEFPSYREGYLDCLRTGIN